MRQRDENEEKNNGLRENSTAAIFVPRSGLISNFWKEDMRSCFI